VNGLRIDTNDAALSGVDVRAPAAMRLLTRWRTRHAVPMPKAALRVLLLQVVALQRPLKSARAGAEGVLALLRAPGLPLICLPGTPGTVNPFARGRAYVADTTCASRNLVEGVDAAGWRAVRAAARLGVGSARARGPTSWPIVRGLP
jgi:hypothetical protein